MKLRITALLTLAALLAAAPLQAEQTGAKRKVLAADDSRRQIAIVDGDGTILWKYKVGGIHDAQVLDNGNILLQTNMQNIVEVDKDGKSVWTYSARTNGNEKRDVEVHAFQRLADGLTMIAESGPARIIEVDKNGKIQREIKMTVKKPHPHRDTRIARKLNNGHYLVSHEGDGAVREYDGDGKVVWEYEVPLFDKKPNGDHGVGGWGNFTFSCNRLPSGNTLIATGNGHSVLEVNPEKQIVWKIEQNDLPGIQLAWVTTLQPLGNGNLIFGNCHAGDKNPQLIEVTRDKKVVWTFKDFKNFGNSCPVTIALDDDGKPLK